MNRVYAPLEILSDHFCVSFLFSSECHTLFCCHRHKKQPPQAISKDKVEKIVFSVLKKIVEDYRTGQYNQ
jgi:hypothetical protein